MRHVRHVGFWDDFLQILGGDWADGNAFGVYFRLSTKYYFLCRQVWVGFVRVYVHSGDISRMPEATWSIFGSDFQTPLISEGRRGVFPSVC